MRSRHDAGEHPRDDEHAKREHHRREADVRRPKRHVDGIREQGVGTRHEEDAERYADENLALPVFAELTEAEVEYVMRAVCDFFSSHD